MDQKRKDMIIGGVAGAGFDTVIDFPIAAIAGTVPAVVIKDAKGNYIWGVGAGDVVGILAGLGLIMVGGKVSPRLKNVGKGWAYSIAIIKGVELLGGIYHVLRRAFPINVTETPVIIPLEAPIAALTAPKVMGATGTGNKSTALPTISNPEPEVHYLFV